jgi:hypothetical protein
MTALLNHRLIRDVRDAWIADQNHPQRGREKRNVPSEDDFRLLLDVCFQASLRTEEGRFVSTSITWLTKEELKEVEIPRVRASELTLRFREPVSLEPKTLAKLSDVANGYSTTFLAARHDGWPVLWGLMAFDPLPHSLTSIPVASASIRHFAPDALTVTTTGVGSLRISRGSFVVGRIEHGQFFIAEPTPLSSTGLLPFVLALHGIHLPPGGQYRNAEESVRGTLFENCFDFLLSALARQHRGATLIFLPAGAAGGDTLPYTSEFRCAGSLDINNLLSEQERISVGPCRELMLLTQRINKALRDRLSALAALGVVDGAVIVEPVLRPIGFGVKLKADSWGGRTVERSAFGVKPEPTLNFDRLGTRHHSARDFVAAVPGSIALVASEDGPIRGLVHTNDGEVWYWPDCRLSMFV